MVIEVVDNQLGIELQECHGDDFSSYGVKRLVAAESRFLRCNFNGLKLDYACFGAGTRMSEYINCSFDQARIMAVTPGRARFVRCTFRNVHLSKWICREVEMVDCVFAGTLIDMVFDAGLAESSAKELHRRSNEYRANNFEGTKFVSVSFRGGIDLSAQTLPATRGHFVIGLKEIDLVLERLKSWDRADQVERAEAYLQVKRSTMEHGQDAVLISPHDKSASGHVARSAHERLIAELTDIVAGNSQLGSPFRG